jgi:hypothetical protein
MSVLKGPSNSTAATPAGKALPERLRWDLRSLWQTPCGAFVDAAGGGCSGTLEEALPFSPRRIKGRKGEPADEALCVRIHETVPCH